MSTKNIYCLVLICFLATLISSCKGSGDWAKEIDQVSIEKTTRYAKEKDGVTPLKSQAGAVTISHKKHDMEGIQCVKCHHKSSNPEREKECAKCHKGNEGYTTMHKLCLNCHIEKGKGPQDCKNCH